MRIAKTNLKKQTQFMKGQNKLKAINYKGLQRIFMVWQRMKTKPNKAKRHALAGNPKQWKSK
jgi:hypothetical protein